MTVIAKYDLQKELEVELERLKKILQLGYELKVRWIPNNNSSVSGQVKGTYIFIYEKDIEVALETLKHEFLDYAISKVVKPYKEVTNRLIALINDIAYRRKERFVEKLTQLVN